MLKYFKTLFLLCLRFSMAQAACGVGCANCNDDMCLECSPGYYLDADNCGMSIFRVEFRFCLIKQTSATKVAQLAMVLEIISVQAVHLQGSCIMVTVYFLRFCFFITCCSKLGCDQTCFFCHGPEINQCDGCHPPAHFVDGYCINLILKRLE